MTREGSLLRSRRFFPLFAAQFLGAANDNLFKNALVVLIVFRLGEAQGYNAPVTVTVAAGLFILPFFLLSATAGQMADRWAKSRLAKRVKLLEIPIMGLGALALAHGSIPFLLFVLTLLGCQAALFGPLKYAILPELLEPGELLTANALTEGATFIAILLGSIAGGLLAALDQGPLWVGAISLAAALAGWLFILPLAATPAPSQPATLDPNPARATGQILREAAAQPVLFLAMLGISWFWLMGATYLSQMPAFTKTILGGDETVVTLVLAVFSIGIGAGSVLCAHLLKRRPSLLPVPLAAMLMSLFPLDLVFAVSGMSARQDDLMGVGGFLAISAHWRILADLFFTAMAGGVYTVPLYTLLQTGSKIAFRARAIAANNILNALFMVASALAATAALGAGWSISTLFMAMAAANLPMALLLTRLLPKGWLGKICGR
jgi:acyl-[acyl-carrier-protein]-phospholipid O-acyltransferase/long-chain-fatty-acid--[acyl-carrier-protein] ligase